MKKALHIYVYGHLHISLCSLLLYIGGYRLVKLVPSLLSCIFIFSSTLLIYTLHRHLAAGSFNKISPIKRYTFMSEHLNQSQIIIAVCALVSFSLFFSLHDTTQFAMIFCGLLSLGYVLPLIAGNRLRDIGVFKIIAISVVWGLLSCLGYLESGGLDTSAILVLLEHVVFIFALTIPFDIRDRDLDDKAQVSNLANQIGITMSKVLMMFLLALAVILVIISFNRGLYNAQLLYAFILFYLIVMTSCYMSKDKKEIYYLLYLDGLILVKGGLLIIAS